MKAMDVIERVDLLEPNDYSPEQKLRWLSALDGRVVEEVIRTHEGGEIDTPPRYETGAEELVIGEPYGGEIYYHYLQAMIAAENSEIQRYNRRMTLFNSAYSAWCSRYAATHAPKHAGDAFRF